MRLTKTSPAILALVAEGFLMRLGFGIVSFSLPLYARHLGLNLAETGVLFALTGVVKVALKPVMGWLADRVGTKRGLVAALGLRSLVSLLLAFASTPWLLYSIRTLHGLSTSLRDPAVNALIAENGDEKAMGSAFAWYFTAKSLANSLGKTIAGFLLTLTASNFTAVFLLTWVISSLTLPAVVIFVPGTNRKRAVEQDDEAESGLAAVGESPESQRDHRSLYAKIAPVVGLGFLISITGSMIDRFYPILATEYAGMTEAQAGAVYLASAVVTLVVGPLIGWLSDHVGRKPTVVARSVANAGSSLLYLVVHNGVGFTLGKLLDDAGKAGFRPAWGAMKADLSSLNKGQRAQMMGWMDVGDDAGDVLGPVGGGLLWDTWGLVGLLVTRIALAGLTEVYAAAVMWRRAGSVTPTVPLLETSVESEAIGCTEPLGGAESRKLRPDPRAREENVLAADEEQVVT
jgi:MFS family permease